MALKNNYEDFKMIHANKEKYRAYFIPTSPEQEQQKRREDSDRFFSLNGSKIT